MGKEVNRKYGKVHAHVLDVAVMVQSFDVTIYIYVDAVLEKQPQN
jgi:hypothetical protein